MVKVPLSVPLCSAADENGKHRQNYHDGKVYNEVGCSEQKPHGVLHRYYPSGALWEKVLIKTV